MGAAIDLSKLSAAELDALIADAFERRAKLQPPHPAKAPEGEQTATLDPAWRVGREDNGDTHLQLQHHGAGWLSFRIPPNERAHLLTVLLYQSLFAPPSAGAPAVPAAAQGSGSGGGTLH